ncbi:hypothetical protein C8J56DRAFT_895045 [Mycena floridula]|nr:hypothetical protein C8J56DRAFT_895045 [Mycena floridula]
MSRYFLYNIFTRFFLISPEQPPETQGKHNLTAAPVGENDTQQAKSNALKNECVNQIIDVVTAPLLTPDSQLCQYKAMNLEYMLMYAIINYGYKFFLDVTLGTLVKRVFEKTSAQWEACRIPSTEADYGTWVPKESLIYEQRV